MNEQRLKYYWQMFVDVWNLFRDYSTPDGSRDFWEKFDTEAERLNQKYAQSELYQALSITVAKELQRIETDTNKEQEEMICPQERKY